MVVIYKSRSPDVVIPHISVTEYVFQDLENKKDYVAVIDGHTGKKLTYGEVYTEIKKVAKGLHLNGVKQGDVVCLMLPNSIEYMVAFHAVSSIGAILTTANPIYTAQELAHQVKDANARFFFTCAAFLEKAEEAFKLAHKTRGKFFVVDHNTAQDKAHVPYAALLQNDAKPPRVHIKHTDTLVIPYSSGTTGLPKGVVLTHYNFVANVVQVSVGLVQVSGAHGDSFLAVLPCFHIYGMSYFLAVGPRLGITVVMMAKYERELYLKLIQTYKVTHLHVAPPILVALAKDPNLFKFDVSSVRYINSGAAPLGAEQEQELQARWPTVDVRQGYGMTELSPTSHVGVARDPLRPAGSSGTLLPNIEARLVDPLTGKDAELGQPGELWLRGPNVMKEYLNNPSATAATIDKDRFLHTGDICVIDVNGYMKVVDRLKELIKYKGFQVAPAELEALLLKHKDILDCAVIGIKDVAEGNGELPKAFVVLKPNAKLTAKEIDDWVNGQVANYKRFRGGIEFVSTIPKSPSGKILRRLLQAPVAKL